jgi:hypothetical protein
MKHHRAHAIGALYDCPLGRPLILSYDGFGEDGAFIFFAGSKASALTDGGVAALRAVRMETWSIGKAFVRVGMSPPTQSLQQITPSNEARHVATKHATSQQSTPRGSKSTTWQQTTPHCDMAQAC